MGYQDTVNRLTRIHTEDLEFEFDELHSRRDEPNFTISDLNDFDMYWVLGHSTGGATVVECCVQNTECDAVLLLDGR